MRPVSLVFLLAATLSEGASAQDEVQDQAVQDQAMARILLFGDQSFSNHHGNAAKALQDRADAVRSPLGYLPTGQALARLDEILDGGPWHIACVNFGLSDLMCRDPRTKAIRALSPAAGGVPVTSAERYGQNLQAIIVALRERGVTPIWTTTLPLRPRNRSSAVSEEAITTYNAVALEVMRRLEVPVIDTHEPIRAALDAVDNPRQLDRTYNELLKADLSGPLVEALRRQVKERR